MNSSVYWIHRPEHTDMFSQGYIGVSNNTKKRWNTHKIATENIYLQRAIKKYGWDSLIKEVVVIADRLYCLAIECKLRSSAAIGWNIVAGGGMPPSSLGKKYIRSAEYREKQSKAHIGQVSANKGKPVLPHVLEAMRQANLGKHQSDESKIKKSLATKGRVSERVLCPNCNTVGGGSSMKRYHFDNCTGAKIFRAVTTINGKRTDLGRYATREQVAIAVKKAHLGE